MSSVRKRNTKAKGTPASPAKVLDDILAQDPAIDKLDKTSDTTESPLFHNVALVLLTLAAFATRFYKINLPKEVVFDEVHFGKFASYYLQRTYFFDLHPPFAKLLIAFVGYLVGYDGSFKFDSIGDSYITNKAPYLAYRSLSAIQGSLTVPVLFLTLRELNYSVPTSVLGAMFVLFDNAHVAETRLILLDATLIFSIACSIYAYVRFMKEQQKAAYSRAWWTWLGLTGVALSCVISTKYVGVFTFITIGAAVILDLWHLLDIETGLTIRQFARHFVARFYGLIVLPFFIYLFWFYVHFEVLTKSGPGDGFMSPAFQETLGDSPLAKDAKQVNYYDTIIFQHKDTGAYLHSHPARYPLRYEDGRVSSQGQQVTTIKNEDENNQWVILPAVDYPEDSKLNHPVKVEDTVRFFHIGTQTYLLAHDVASPLFPTNEEFTTIDEETAQTRYNETLFKLQPADKSSKGSIIKTKANRLRVLHRDTAVAMWTHDDVTLPEWAYHQFEVNGNKKIQDAANTWTFDSIVGLSDSRQFYVPKPVKKLPFFRKWWELQFQMFHQNNKLSSEHPFASEPITWPVSLAGVSFWTKNETRQQIYFLGNLFGWWVEVIVMALFAGLFLGAKIAEQRNIQLLSVAQRKQLLNIGFLYLGYLSHYVFFFLMARQKFLHHYLPAHMIAGLLTAAILEFIIGKGQRLNALLVVLAAGLIYSFIFFAPITYGDVSLSVAEVKARQFFDIKLHFAK
ncbi:CYFA0S24e00342g1_1 [Cyberlindnera fabianii]|uniref:Dolichyl-phosphate-mannose--protein mannosyltransferase n=1 Tax=Cyberlindnera fabianii TaxID=36022 RepID=A0A061BFC5_CYBFA|nr:CYFA0S24e00342g1_1 [Cyberlindnera fabianii]